MYAYTCTAIISLFLCGCHWPGVDTNLPLPNPTTGNPNAPKMPPQVPKRTMKALPQVTVVPTNPPVVLPDFRFATNPCATTWTLQGSKDLITWVDLGYSGVCPTNTIDLTNTVPSYYYRLKGTAVQQ